MIADIAAGLAAAVNRAPDVGVVLDWQPLPTANDWATFVRRFTTEINGIRQVRAWSIAYVSERRSYRNAGHGKLMRELTFLVRGHLTMRGDTEPVFRDLVESVVTSIDSDPGLGGTVIEHDACDVSVPDNGAGLFLGDVLVHYAEITVVARVEQTL